MKDAGFSHKPHQELSMPSGQGGANTKIYPSMSIDHKSMPHMKKHNVGDTGTMKVKYKVTHQRQYRSGEGETGIDITHYEPAARVKGKDDKELDAEAKSDEDKQPKAEQK